MSEHWYCKITGQEVGPLTQDELREMFTTGQIASDDRIRSSAHPAWQRLARVFPDIAAGSSDRKTWYFHSFGDEFGPCSFKELREYAEKGQISPSDDVREGTSGPWRQARLVKDLFPHADDILSGFDTLEDAPEEALVTPKPQVKPRPKPKPSPAPARARPAASPSTSPARSRPAEPKPVPTPPPPSHAATPPAASAPEPAPAAAASSHASAAAVMNEPAPTPAPEPEPPRSSSFGTSPPPRPTFRPPPPSSTSGGGGGFELPDWLVDGKIMGIAVGVLVVLGGGGWFLMNSGMFSAFAAGGVYDNTVALYEEYQTASKEGPNSQAFQSFYQDFKKQQYEMFKQIGQPDYESSAYEVKKALQYLGSVVEGFKRESTTEEAQQAYVQALENQLKKLKPEYGG